MTLYNIYYSPTGGTKRVSDIISGAMSESFDRVDLIRKDGFARCYGKNDICIISVPAFGGRVPEDALNKIRCFKPKGTRAVLVAVFGNRAIDDTLAELYDTVREAGFDVIAAIEAVAEHSLAPQYGSGRPNAEDRAELEGYARQICKSIDNRLENIPGNRPYKEYHPSSMTLALDDTCINCKKCARECPVEAISPEDVRRVDGDRCFSCMHCVSICPMKARHNSPEVTAALEERLRERCAGVKANKLYI